MKPIYSFYILVGMSCLFSLASCEKSNSIKTVNLTDGFTEIIYRSSCTECPGVDECCCAVWVQDPLAGYAQVSLCGTSDGANGCSGDAVGDCSSFSGGGQSFTLAPPFLPGKRRFCMNEGDAFWIANTHTSLSMNIYLTCQDDITNAQVLQITIPAGQRWYYSVSNACALSPCGD